MYIRIRNRIGTARGILLVAALVGCSGKLPVSDDFSDLDGADEKSDRFSKKLKFEGTLAVGQTSDPVDYENPPLYRAFKFKAEAGTKVDIWVRSEDGDALAWLTDKSYKVLDQSDDTDDSTDSHLAATLKTASTYSIIFREYKSRPATFTVSLEGNAPVCVSKGCAERGFNCGVVDDGCGGKIKCGACSGGDICGGGGQANICGRQRKCLTSFNNLGKRDFALSFDITTTAKVQSSVRL